MTWKRRETAMGLTHLVNSGTGLQYDNHILEMFWYIKSVYRHVTGIGRVSTLFFLYLDNVYIALSQQNLTDM